MDFGSLNTDNLENIINSLSREDMQQLSDLAQSFMSAEKDKREESRHGSDNSDSIDFDPAAAAKIMEILHRLRKQKDSPGCHLLKALRPMLSPEKQRKTDEAINMLRILSLLPLIDELKG